MPAMMHFFFSFNIFIGIYKNRQYTHIHTNDTHTKKRLQETMETQEKEKIQFNRKYTFKV